MFKDPRFHDGRLADDIDAAEPRAAISFPYWPDRAEVSSPVVSLIHRTMQTMEKDMQQYPVGGPRKPVYDLMRKLGLSESNWSDKIWRSADKIEVSIFGAGSMARILLGGIPKANANSANSAPSPPSLSGSIRSFSWRTRSVRLLPREQDAIDGLKFCLAMVEGRSE